MFRSAENLRLAADMRALERVARPWREARRTWFDGTPESIEARLAATDRVLAQARSGFTAAHLALTDEAEAARAELTAARHRLLTDFLDDGARAFRGSKRLADMYVGDLPRDRASELEGHMSEILKRIHPTKLRTAAINFLADQNTDDRQELLFRAHRHAADRTGQLPVMVAQRVVQSFVAAVSREIGRTAGCTDEPCDGCNAEAGEDCRPWCTGKAKHDDEAAEKKTKKSHRTAAIADFPDELMF